jgi:hypothetical protein
MQPLDNYQYHIQLPWKIVHRIYTNAIYYLQQCNQSGCESVPQLRSLCSSITSFLNVVKFTILKTLFLPFCRLSFSIFCLKIFSVPNFSLKSKRIIFWYLGKWSKPALDLHKSNFLSSPFSLICAGTCQTMILNQRPLRTLCDILPQIDPTLLTVDTFWWCTKIPVLNLYFSFSFS